MALLALFDRRTGSVLDFSASEAVLSFGDREVNSGETSLFLEASATCALLRVGDLRARDDAVLRAVSSARETGQPLIPAGTIPVVVTFSPHAPVMPS